MLTDNAQSYLPSEILLQIIDCLIPQSTLPPIALPSSHPTTVTLLSLARTSRIIYPTALRHLYTHCLYINSPNRLHTLVATLSSTSAGNNAPPRLRTLPFVPLLHYTTSLYLEAFHIDSTYDDDTVSTVYTLLNLLAPVLRRLIINIPLRSLYPLEHRDGVQPLLRQGFSQLKELELFCSVNDELYLDFEQPMPDGEPTVWSLWPKLRTLALYNADVSNESFWRCLGKLKGLETLILTRSDGVEEVDIKKLWKLQGGDAKLSVVLVNVESQHRIPLGRDAWKAEDKMDVKVVNVPTSYYGDEDVIELCQDWVKRCMLRGDQTIES